MKKIFFALLFCLLMLTSCTAGEKDYLGYGNCAFVCEVKGKLDNGTAFSAKIACGERETTALPDGKDEVKRDVEITFTAPSSLAGIKVSRIGGRLSADLCGISISSEKSAGFLQFAELFDGYGRVCRVENGELDGKKVNIVTLEGGSSHKIYIDASSGTPLRIENTNGDVLDVIWFERK